MVRMAYVWLLTMTRNAAIQTGMVVWLLHLYICIYTYVWNTHAKGPVLHDARRGGETTVERCYMCNGHLSSFHLLYAIYIYIKMHQDIQNISEVLDSDFTRSNWHRSNTSMYAGSFSKQTISKWHLISSLFQVLSRHSFVKFKRLSMLGMT